MNDINIKTEPTIQTATEKPLIFNKHYVLCPRCGNQIYKKTSRNKCEFCLLPLEWPHENKISGNSKETFVV